MAAQKAAGRSAKSSTVSARIEKQISRPGVHSKTKTSSNKNSKNYKKPYAGQGR